MQRIFYRPFFDFCVTILSPKMGDVSLCRKYVAFNLILGVTFFPHFLKIARIKYIGPGCQVHEVVYSCITTKECMSCTLQDAVEFVEPVISDCILTRRNKEIFVVRFPARTKKFLLQKRYRLDRGLSHPPIQACWRHVLRG
jgi:hypothetical protein